MSTKRDQLGGGRFGSVQTRPVSARRQAVADATGVATTGAPDSRLRTLPLEQLVPTRFNPRRNFSEEALKEFGAKLGTKQLQPAVAVTREAYLKLWEDEADAVGPHRYVIANGERRYRASQLVGLETLEVIVDDTIAETRATFLDAVLSENNDREDLNPVEQAIGIQTMVDQLGGKARVAEHYGKSAGWVTQQLYLLKLAPELQDLVSAGTLPVRETRALIKLPIEDQATAWEARLKARAEDGDQKSGPRTEASHAPPRREASPGFTAVKNSGSEPTPPTETSTNYPAGINPEGSLSEAEPDVKAEATESEAQESTQVVTTVNGTETQPAPTTPDSVPEPRAEQEQGGKPEEGEGPRGKPIRWDEPGYIANLIRKRMEDPHFFTMLGFLLTQASDRDSDRLQAVIEAHAPST